jgi:hypothetical protein
MKDMIDGSNVGMFLPSCIAHEMKVGPGWTGLQAGGVILRDAFGSWHRAVRFGGSVSQTTRLKFIDECYDDLPCNPYRKLCMPMSLAGLADTPYAPYDPYRVTAHPTAFPAPPSQPRASECPAGQCRDASTPWYSTLSTNCYGTKAKDYYIYCGGLPGVAPVVNNWNSPPPPTVTQGFSSVCAPDTQATCTTWAWMGLCSTLEAFMVITCPTSCRSRGCTPASGPATTPAPRVAVTQPPTGIPVPAPVVAQSGSLTRSSQCPAYQCADPSTPWLSTLSLRCYPAKAKDYYVYCGNMPRTATACGQDVQTQCSGWAAQGLCSNPSNQLWMSINCARTCNPACSAASASVPMNTCRTTFGDAPCPLTDTSTHPVSLYPSTRAYIQSP